MKLTSDAFLEQGYIPMEYTCQGDNINPSLFIHDIPPETKSLALIVHDPDAPVGDFTHWIVWNIDPKTEEIDRGTIPVGACEGLNDARKPGWTGPCPPSGTHRYIFNLFALSAEFNDLPPTIKHKEFLDKIREAIITEATLTGLYSKH